MSRRRVFALLVVIALSVAGGIGSDAQNANGQLLFLRDATLMAQPFDVRRLALTGEVVSLADSIDLGVSVRQAGAFAASETGAFAYQTGAGEIRSQLVWFDRSGKQLATLGEPVD